MPKIQHFRCVGNRRTLHCMKAQANVSVIGRSTTVGADAHISPFSRDDVGIVPYYFWFNQCLLKGKALCILHLFNRSPKPGMVINVFNLPFDHVLGTGLFLQQKLSAFSKNTRHPRMVSLHPRLSSFCIYLFFSHS